MYILYKYIYIDFCQEVRAAAAPLSRCWTGVLRVGVAYIVTVDEYRGYETKILNRLLDFDLWNTIPKVKIEESV